MPHQKSFAVCVFAFLLLGCPSVNDPAINPINDPTINMDNEGMRSVEHPSICVRVSYFPTDTAIELLPYEVIGEFKARLYIGVDKKVKKVVYLEGNEANYVLWHQEIKNFGFVFSHDALPGPWELDLLIKTGLRETFSDDVWKISPGVPNDAILTSYRPIAYRRAKAR
jgi:hypothetical protein